MIQKFSIAPTSSFKVFVIRKNIKDDVLVQLQSNFPDWGKNNQLILSMKRIIKEAIDSHTTFTEFTIIAILIYIIYPSIYICYDIFFLWLLLLFYHLTFHYGYQESKLIFNANYFLFFIVVIFYYNYYDSILVYQYLMKKVLYQYSIQIYQLLCYYYYYYYR